MLEYVLWHFVRTHSAFCFGVLIKTCLTKDLGTWIGKCRFFNKLPYLSDSFLKNATFAQLVNVSAMFSITSLYHNRVIQRCYRPLQKSSPSGPPKVAGDLIQPGVTRAFQRPIFRRTVRWVVLTRSTFISYSGRPRVLLTDKHSVFLVREPGPNLKVDNN